MSRTLLRDNLKTVVEINLLYFYLTNAILFVVRTLFIYIVLVSPATAIFEECRCCFPLYFVELLTVMSTKIVSCLVVCSSPSDQSNFVEPKVNLLIKDTRSKRHWGKTKSFLKKIGAYKSEWCPCGMIQTVDHLINTCSLLGAGR